MKIEPIFFEDVYVGMELPVIQKIPSRTMLFRFSAVTWNAHRIHYDENYAKSEGHDGVLVQATMHGAFLLQMITQFAGVQGRVLEFSYSNRGKAIPGDVLTVGGNVASFGDSDSSVKCNVWEVNQAAETCAVGTALIELPRKRLSIGGSSL